MNTRKMKRLFSKLNYEIGVTGCGPTPFDRKPGRKLTSSERVIFGDFIDAEKRRRRGCFREAVLEVTGEDVDEDGRI